MWWWVGGGWVVDQAITNPISGPGLSFVFCLLALSLTIIFTFTRLHENYRFQYPSVTICPEKSFKTSDFIPYLGTYEDNQDFYLKNVRSLNEVFFFVNQRTRTRPGHKCMTEERSSDRGRPCVFPFQSQEK